MMSTQVIQPAKARKAYGGPALAGRACRTKSASEHSEGPSEGRTEPAYGVPALARRACLTKTASEHSEGSSEGRTEPAKAGTPCVFIAYLLSHNLASVLTLGVIPRR